MDISCAKYPCSRYVFLDLFGHLAASLHHFALWVADETFLCQGHLGWLLVLGVGLWRELTNRRLHTCSIGVWLERPLAAHHMMCPRTLLPVPAAEHSSVAVRRLFSEGG